MDPTELVSALAKALPTVVGFIAGFLTAVFADPLRQWLFRPVLSLQFESSDHFVTKTPEGDPPDREAYYIRVKVTNTSGRLAKGCRAYLVGIDKWGPAGSWDATDYCENLQLAWSARPDALYSALDLPKGVPFFVDVVSTRERASGFWPALAFTPYRFRDLFSTTGKYRFTVLVTGDGLKDAKLSISFKWTGAWNQFEVAAV